ncbi:MAG: hypothetical protein M1819_001627 [Sarea resinae]|nr:MAG: hypothetical protein M1819_001627 [Sarea resinae]
MIRNRPGRLLNITTFSDYQIKFQDLVRNCEDVLLDEKRGIAILSCDPGRDKWNTVMGTFINPNTSSGSLWYYRYSKYRLQESGAIDRLQMEGFDSTKLMGFHPLGIAHWPQTGTLYVVNHAESGSTVEVLKLDRHSTGAKYQRTLSHPLLHTPNSVAPISDHEIYVTNDHRWEKRNDPKKSVLETYTGFPGGSVVYVNLQTDTYRKVADVHFANGITTLNSTHLAVASTTTPAVFVYRIEPRTKALVMTKKVTLPFMVDNLSTDSTGHLLMAGHPSPSALGKAAKTNHMYDIDGTGVGKPATGRPRGPSWVAEWDGNPEGTIKSLYVGTEFSTSSTAVRDADRGRGIVVGLYEKGLLLWNE